MVASPPSDWFTRVWTTDDGLLNDQVDAIVQGSDGYLWVVPPVGLMRFDGVRFSRFPLEDYTSPTDDHIEAVLPSRSGVLWIALFGGTVIGLNPDFSMVAMPQNALPEGTALGLAEDKEGALWLAYPDLICRFKDGHVARFGAGKGVPPGEFHALVSDGAGNIWLAAGDQISVFRNGQFQRVANASEVRLLAATPTNAVWMISETHLFHCDTRGVLHDEGTVPGLASARGNAMLQDHAGAVWIGTDGNGLIRYDASGFQKVETSYPSVRGLAEDREGNIWAGTFGDGLDRISSSSVWRETLQYEDAAEQVQSICEDADGRLWGVAYSGQPYYGLLVSRVNGEWTPVFTNAPFSGNVTCVAADHHGAIWIGALNGKLLRLAGANYSVCVDDPGLGIIHALLPASSGDLWMVDRRLQRLHDGKLQEVKLPRSLGRITAITEDSTGAVWIGGRGVLLRFDGDHLTDESRRFPIARRWVNCLYGSSDGSLWISGGGLGLLRLKDGQVGQIGIDQGLYDDFIAQIVADRRGWFWFAGDQGIFKVRRHELEQAMNDRGSHLHPVVYGRNEGLSSLAALVSTSSPFGLPRGLCSRDGRVWLLTRTDVVMADPNRSRENSTPPTLLLTRVAMDGQTIASFGDVPPTQNVANLAATNAPLRLPPSFRHLEFDFTAFHFSAPEDLHFQYQLAGFDNGWIDAQAERHADYSRLAAGKYQFKVEAAVNEGPWNELPATLTIVVSPFFWQTWWFRLGALLLFTLSGIAIVRYVSFRRLQQKMRLLEQRSALDRERARIARDLHDDLGCSLNKIALTMETMQRGPAVPEPVIQHCWTMVREAAGSVDEIVWAINPRNDTLRYMVDYISQFAVEFLQAADVSCLIDLPDNVPDRMVSPEARHNLLLVVKEALNNVIRHAAASEVRMHITVAENQVGITIEDNGRGFEHLPDNGTCDGLRNMRQRMDEIGGQFQLTSKLGAGTRIVLSMTV